MNKKDILSEYKKQEDKICLSQVLEKVEKSNSQQKIESTDFLDMYQISLVECFLKKNKIVNYEFFGGCNNSERRILVIFPEKYTKEMLQKNYSKMLKIVRVSLKNEQLQKLNHRNYLGAIVGLGLKREKVGDILVHDKGADIITLVDFSVILEKELTGNFDNADISIEEIDNVTVVEELKEEIKIIIPSFRLDNIVSDLARTSRSKASDLIKAERIFVNGKCETKQSKTIKIEDMITIRGKGRFLIKKIDGTTRSNNTVLVIEKYV